MDKIRILQVVPNMNSGGIENLIMNIYRNIDRDKIQFDFLVHHKNKGYFDDEIEKLGGKIYRMSVCDDYNIFKYINEINRFFKQHTEYHVVHGHMASLAYLYLGAAKKNGVKMRIAHSHGTSHLKSLKGYMKFILFKGAKRKSNIYYACSTEAGKYLFGNEQFTIIPNAIDLEKFKYNEEKRKNLRKKYNFNDNTTVFINVGRFNLQKNHLFLLDIFNEYQKLDNNAFLFLAGDGELRNQIEAKIEKLKLKNKVKMLGVINNVYDYYQCSDLFCMPSLFEGLPVTGIEAQTSKIKCFFSNTITKEVIVSDNTEFVNLDDSPTDWASFIYKNKNYDRKNVHLYNDDFDIKKLSKKIEGEYIKLFNKE